MTNDDQVPGRGAGGRSAEARRLARSPRSEDPWRQWGPYLSARQWGTVREDYSADGDAWAYLPFEQAHARAYRWGEDGLLGICDRWQHMCLGLALWNGRDPILKERLFGLTNGQGNHGEDVKEYWWVLDGTPTHSWMQALYRYPQAEFPYRQLRDANSGRGRDQREYELADTGVLADDRFFDVVVTYAKAAPDDLLMVVEATNRGPDPAPLHLLPQVWYRNTWAWGRDSRRPVLSGVFPEELGLPGVTAVRCDHETLGEYWLAAEGTPDLLVTHNETNAVALFGAARNAAEYTKDGVGERVVRGADSTDPRGVGTKAALWWRWEAVGPGQTVRVRLRLRPDRPTGSLFGADYEATLAGRRAEADDFYAEVLPDRLSPAERQVARRAFAGLLWTKKVYRYGVRAWLEGDPGQPEPPPSRTAPNARNVGWPHVDLAEVMSLPDEWEYPWFAAWDSAFHCVSLAVIDAEFAKHQLVLLCREWLMHPAGQLPAYEWAFGDVNPPVHAWAALRVYRIDARLTGRPDRSFLARVFTKLLLNFSWWVNRKDADGSNLFEGGFLGMDNIGLFDRSAPPPPGYRLEQSDATSWMAMYCLSMLDIALELAQEDRAYDDVATKFLEHFLAIAAAANSFGSHGVGLWDSQEGFFFDVLTRDEVAVPLRVRSMVGLIPLFAVALLRRPVLDRLPDFTSRLHWLTRRRPDLVAAVLRADSASAGSGGDTDGSMLLSLADEACLRRVLAKVFDPGEFLSPYGVRSLSAAHRGGYTVTIDGAALTIDYEPGESSTGLFGGNSNWRGPVWFPVNLLLAEALRTYHRYFGDKFTIEMPTGSGRPATLLEAAEELERRLVALFLPAGEGGRRPSDPVSLPAGPLWHEHPTFSEYFHGDTGEGLGASHQTGWTALVAAILTRRGGEHG